MSLFSGFSYNLFSLCISSSSSFPTQKPCGVQPHHEQSECEMGARHRSGAAVQGLLRPAEWHSASGIGEWDKQAIYH